MILSLVLAFTILYQIRVNKTQPKKLEMLLSYEQTTSLKGIMALIVMEGHIVKNSNFSYLFLLDKAGTLAVSIFFFLSGYSLMINYMEQKNYLNNFLKKRMISLLLPWYICYLFYVLIYLCFVKHDFNLANFFGVKIFEFTNWFIYVIFFLYLIFYLTLKYCNDNTKVVIFISILILSVMILGYTLKFERVYWGGTLSFPIGMWLAKNKINAFKFLRLKLKSIIFYSTLGVVLGGGGYIIIGEYSFWGDLVFRNIATTAIVFLLLSMLHFFTIKNVISNFLGKHSYYIFLLHVLFIFTFHSNRINIKNDEFYVFIVMTSTLLSSILAKKIFEKISKSKIFAVNPSP